MDKPRFVIVNTYDAPCRRRVCEWVEGVGYCYCARSLEPHLKEFDGMMPRDPTPIEAFGFTVAIRGSEAMFDRTGESTAVYEDGKPRNWQDHVWDKQFSLPLVTGVKKPRKKK